MSRDCVHKLVPCLPLLQLVLDHPLARSRLFSPRTSEQLENQHKVQANDEGNIQVVLTGSPPAPGRPPIP